MDGLFFVCFKKFHVRLSRKFLEEGINPRKWFLICIFFNVEITQLEEEKDVYKFASDA